MAILDHIKYKLNTCAKVGAAYLRTYLSADSIALSDNSTSVQTEIDRLKGYSDWNNCENVSLGKQKIDKNTEDYLVCTRNSLNIGYGENYNYSKDSPHINIKKSGRYLLIFNLNALDSKVLDINIKTFLAYNVKDGVYNYQEIHNIGRLHKSNQNNYMTMVTTRHSFLKDGNFDSLAIKIKNNNTKTGISDISVGLKIIPV